MSDILARIRVRETHGIRRFLYPLTTFIPSDWPIYRKGIVVKDSHGESLPTAIMEAPDERGRLIATRLVFADSLAPYESKNYTLVIAEEEMVTVTDEIRYTSFSTTENGGLLANYSGMRTQQDRVSFGIAEETGPEPKDISLVSVVYDTIKALREPLRILLDDRAFFVSDKRSEDQTLSYGSICASVSYIQGDFDGQQFAFGTHYRVPFCKSWVQVDHIVQMLPNSSTVTFLLPLAITSPTLTCDFGVGGYVFGKLDANAPEIVWHTDFGDAPYAKWTVATAGRVDYVGEVETAEEFLPQRWFHLIDSDKALAVAITRLPEGSQSMTVRLTHEGDVSVAFKMGDRVMEHAEFGVCYHFLNDVPAIAAATNPQSILLPPTVEVLPVT